MSSQNLLTDIVKIKTCAGCPYWQVCKRTDEKHLCDDFPEMLCQLETDHIIAKFREVIEGAGLTDDALRMLLYYFYGYDKTMTYEEFKAGGNSADKVCEMVAAAQRQAILKAIDKDNKETPHTQESLIEWLEQFKDHDTGGIKVPYDEWKKIKERK